MAGSFIQGFRDAIRGFFASTRSEKHMKIHLAVSCMVIVAGICLKADRTEWCFLIGAMAAVISLELLNTAIEKTVDLVSPDFHPLAGMAKDAAAAAVLVAAIGAAAIGILILGPKLLDLLEITI